MKVIVSDKNHYEIFLNKFYDKNIDFNNQNELEDYFKDIFLKLKNYYNLDIGGYYLVDAYKDEFYGVILNITKEELDYYEDFCDEIDMRINLHKNYKFIYKIEDPLELPKTFLKKGYYIFYKNKYYYLIKENLELDEELKLLEYTCLEYKDTDNILNYGKKIKEFA